MSYDIVIVGAGLFGSIIAREAKQAGLRTLVVERRNHIGGNCYTEPIKGINVHKYGAHIFRTNDRLVWNYLSQFAEFNNFVNSPVANYKGDLYNLPFNMNTFYELWKTKTPAEAKRQIQAQRVPCDNPRNLEEHVLNMVGTDIYNKLVKGYTEKQWGKPCTELPASIMRRIPLRFTYDNNYFDARYQGIPIGGYTAIFEKLLDGVEVRLNTDFLDSKEDFISQCSQVIYTGPIDEYYGYCYGPLEYRALRFEHEVIECDNYQGVAVMNFTDFETPYTRIIEHKHFEKADSSETVISREYPCDWHVGDEPYYPMEDVDNREKYNRYRKLAATEGNVLFGGRLGGYRYYDMQDTVKVALETANSLLCNGTTYMS